MSPNDTSIVLRGAGLDCVGNLVMDGYIRPAIMVNGELYGSLVDLMAVFGADNRQKKNRKGEFNPRRYWNQRKKTLLGKDEELSQSVRQTKLLAEDGKMRDTDIAPLWACVFIILLMDTDSATEFKKRIAKFTAAEIKYRMINVANGLEWAADTTHEALKDSDPPDQLTAWQEQGYS